MFWIQLHILNFSIIGMLTIFLPTMYYGNPVLTSTFLFFSGIYLVILYFAMLYFKDSRDKSEKKFRQLQQDYDKLLTQNPSFKP